MHGLFQTEELLALDLPSKNDEMGASLIEGLDDSALAMCFDFLSAKEACSGVERTCHRFLQANRNRPSPFEDESVHWGCVDPSNLPIYRLLNNPNMWIPEYMLISKLRRFRVTELSYSPENPFSVHSRHSINFGGVCLRSRQACADSTSEVQFCGLTIVVERPVCFRSCFSDCVEWLESRDGCHYC